MKFNCSPRVQETTFIYLVTVIQKETFSNSHINRTKDLSTISEHFYVQIAKHAPRPDLISWHSISVYSIFGHLIRQPDMISGFFTSGYWVLLNTYLESGYCGTTVYVYWKGFLAAFETTTTTWPKMTRRQEELFERGPKRLKNRFYKNKSVRDCWGSLDTAGYFFIFINIYFILPWYTFISLVGSFLWINFLRPEFDPGAPWPRWVPQNWIYAA